MGSYTSVMNDTTSTLYIKYAANHVGLKVVAIITAVLGVIAAVVTGGIAFIAVSAPVVAAGIGLGTAGTVVGVGAGGLSLAALISAAIDISAKSGGYHAVPPGGTYRSEKLSLSLVHQADVKLTAKVNDTALNMWSGSFTVFSGPTADSTKNYFVSQQLSKLDSNLVMISDTTGSTSLELDALFANFTRVYYDKSTIGFGEQLALNQNCSLAGLN
ncbi:hypothetical protein B0H12DRAFT_1287486 [Mycena haematopus]|nr:hypothetical protein B0H12DRAFT_1287486 [Mycena haematopus]